jgi:hypothetical protein
MSIHLPSQKGVWAEMLHEPACVLQLLNEISILKIRTKGLLGKIKPKRVSDSFRLSFFSWHPTGVLVPVLSILSTCIRRYTWFSTAFG